MPNRKSVSGVIAFVMFFLMLGTVGGIENDTIPLLPGMIQTFAFMGLWVLFSHLAGAFDYPQERSEPREVQRENPDARPGRTGREGPGPSGRAKNHR
jgi:hypothetical protein